MCYLVDPHSTPSGDPCTLGSWFLDLDTSSPLCDCGHRITVEHGLDPHRLVPHELSARAEFHAFATPQVCPAAPELVAVGTRSDQWDHVALVVCWNNSPTLIGPSQHEALRTICQLTPTSMTHHREARAWLGEQWTAHASTRALLEARAQTRRRAARVARLASGRQLVTA